jgi:hypothetical protein
MGQFTDSLLLRMTDDTFVRNLLAQALGPTNLFEAVFAFDSLEVHNLTLDSIERREFARLTLEPIRTLGINERLVPGTERTRIERTQLRSGRMAWIDALVDVALTAKTHSTGFPLESLTVKNLTEELGGVSTLTQLRAKLETMYAPSVVEAFFSTSHIETIEDFERDAHLFLRFAFKAPPPFDPHNPGAPRTFRLTVCVMIHDELKISAALQNAKLCRSILTMETDSAGTIPGGEIVTPYAFAVVFPDAAVTDQTLPALTAAQVKAMTKSIFRSERMVAHFG